MSLNPKQNAFLHAQGSGGSKSSQPWFATSPQAPPGQMKGLVPAVKSPTIKIKSPRASGSRGF